MSTAEIVKADIEAIIWAIGPDVNRFQGKSVVLSGGCGFLGSWFVAVFAYLNRYMFKSPVMVHVIDSFIAADKGKQNTIIDMKEWDPDGNILFEVADIATYDFGDKEYKYIIHAAGIASPIYYRKFPIQTIEGMVMGLNNLLKHAVKKIPESMLYFSSSEMYGNPIDSEVPTKETYNGNVSCIGPRSCYDESKRMGETMCMVYHKTHAVPVKWVRPFNVYGPGMRETDDRVVPKFIYQMLNHEDITLHKPGVQTRTFCYITNAMTGFFKVLLSGLNGNVYNIGAANPELTIEELADELLGIIETKSKVVAVEMPPEYPTDQAQRRCPDIAKARTVGYDPKIGINYGLGRMTDWCIAYLEEKAIPEETDHA